jgi:hypothetical protein
MLLAVPLAAAPHRASGLVLSSHCRHRLPLFCRQFWRHPQACAVDYELATPRGHTGHAVAGRSVSSSRMQAAKWPGLTIRRGGTASAHAGTA